MKDKAKSQEKPIEELKRLRRRVVELEEAEEKYRALVESAGAVIFSLDSKGQITYISPIIESLSGYRPDEVIGTDFSKYIAAEDLPGLLASLERTMSGKREPYEFRVMCKDGGVRHVVSSSRVIFQNGEIAGLSGVITDITEHKNADRALQRSEERFRTLIESSLDMTVIVDNQGRITYFSPNYKSIWGRDVIDDVGVDIFKYIHADDIPLVSESFVRLLKDPKEAIQVTVRVISSDGMVRVLDAVAHNQMSNPVVGGIVVNFRDVTESRYAEEKFRTLFENSSNPITVYDRDGNLLMVNPRGAKNLGKPAKELVGSSVKEFFPRQYKEYIKRFRRVIDEGGSLQFEDKVTVSSGDAWFWSTLEPIRDATGVPYGVQIISYDITERKRIEESLRESDEKYSTLVENANDGVVIIQDKLIKYANKRMCEMSGYSAEELVGMSTFNLAAPDIKPIIEERFAQAERNQPRPNTFYTKMMCKDGTVIENENSISFIQYNGRSAVLSIVRDITEHKRLDNALRENEQKYRLLADYASDVITFVDTDIKPIYISPSVTRVLGYSVEEVMANGFEGKMTPASQEKVVKLFLVQLDRERRNPGSASNSVVELDMIHKDGSIINVEIAVSFVRDADGAIVGGLGITRDITERKRAEKALQENEEKYRLLAENATDLIAVVSMDRRLTYISPSVTRLLGYTVDEVLALSMEEVYTPDSVERTKRAVAEDVAIEQKGQGGHDRSRTIELELYHKDGRVIPIEVIYSFLRDAEGSPIAMLSVSRDISERKHADEKLRFEEQRFRALAEQSSDVIILVNRDGTIAYENKRVELALGLKPEERIGASILDHVHPDDMKTVIDSFGALKDYAGTSVHRSEVRLQHQDGSWHTFEAMASSLVIDNVNQGMLVNLRYITERKKVEETLQESEEWHRALIETAGRSGLGIVALQTSPGREAEVIYFNEQALSITGYSQDEAVGKTLSDIIPHDSFQEIVSRYRDRQQGKPVPYYYEAELLRKDRSRVPVVTSVAVMQLHGKPATVVYFRDITEDKKAEDALQVSEKKMRSLFEVSPDVIMNIDCEGRILFINRAMTRTVEETIGTFVYDYIPPEYQSLYAQTIENVFRTGKPDRIETKGLGPGRRISWYEARFILLESGEEKPSLMVIATDITEKKQAEEARKKSEEKFRTAFDSANTGICLVSLNGNLIRVNNKMSEIFGYSVEELERMTVNDIALPEDRDLSPQFMKKAVDGEVKGSVFEKRYRSKEGKIVWGQVSSALVRDADGEPLYFISQVQDITERKRTEEALRESEAKYRTLVEQSLLGIVMVQDGRVVYVNHVMEDRGGYSLGELSAMSQERLMEIIHPEDRDTVRSRMLNRLSGSEEPERNECRFIAKDGSVYWADVHTTIVEYLGKPAIYMFVVDISERKKAEAALSRIEERIKSIVSTSQEWIWAINAKGEHTFSNPAIEDILGYRPDEVIGRNALDLLYEDDIPVVKQILARCIELKTAWSNLVLRWKHKNGGYRYLESNAVPILDAAGVLVGFQGTDRDITIRKQAEENLREARDYMENLIEHANVPMVVWTPDFRITRFNRAFERLTGMKAKTVIGQDLEILFPKDSRDRSLSYIRTAIRGARWEVVEIPIVGVKGAVKTVLWNISPIYAEDGKTPMAIIAQGQDITERKQAEEALRESEELSRSMLDNAAMGIYLLQDKKFLYVNPTFEKILGYPSAELVGQEALNYVHPGDRAIVRIKAVENLKEVSTQPYEFRALRKDGKQIWVMERVTSIRYRGRRAAIASFMETTEHRKAEVELERAYEELKTAHDRMVQSEKLRAMGEMASGIAHDFNNMLAVILGRTQLIIDDVNDDKVKKGIQIIEQAALDAAKTVKRLQDFARIRVEHPFEILDINEVVEGVLKMVETRRVELEQTKGIVINIEHEFGKVGAVSGDAAELREALLNILFNALDAMPSGGKLIVKSWKDGDWVQISIKDTGVGIPDKVKGRVFEPFYTTKASKGSGLGLSVTYGIIARHGGMIKFDSTVGKGTTFYVRLPVTVEVAKKTTKKPRVIAVKPANILVVDDEPEVLQALSLTLGYFGHWVKSISSGAEAIKAFKDGNYDLVITDLGMPEVSGWDVARAIKKSKPDVPVLLITGWVIDMDEEQKKIVDGVIAKPFSRDSISSAIAQVFPAKKRTGKKESAGKKKPVGKKPVRKNSAGKKSGQ